MAAPLQHRVVLKHNEVMAAAMAARSRPLSLHWLFLLLLVGLVLAVWVGHLFAFWFVQRLPFEWMFAIGTYLPTVIPALFAYFVVVLVAQAQNFALRRAYLSSLTKLDIPLEREGIYEVLPEGLKLTTERITLFPLWHAIDTIERVRQGWAISADQLTFLLPSGSFADEANERAVISAIVGHLPEPARERSGAAVSFVAG